MKFNQENDELERLHLLIKRKGTGTLEQLADKFGVCVNTIKNRIKILKEKGAPIEYCRNSQTYHYTREVEITFFTVKTVDNSKNIRGGENSYNFFSPSQNFWLDPFDLCNRLTNNEGQSGARSFGFSTFRD